MTAAGQPTAYRPTPQPATHSPGSKHRLSSSMMALIISSAARPTAYPTHHPAMLCHAVNVCSARGVQISADTHGRLRGCSQGGHGARGGGGWEGGEGAAAAAVQGHGGFRPTTLPVLPSPTPPPPPPHPPSALDALSALVDGDVVIDVDVDDSPTPIRPLLCAPSQPCLHLRRRRPPPPPSAATLGPIPLSVSPRLRCNPVLLALRPPPPPSLFWRPTVLYRRC